MQTIVFRRAPPNTAWKRFVDAKWPPDPLLKLVLAPKPELIILQKKPRRSHRFVFANGLRFSCKKEGWSTIYLQSTVRVFSRIRIALSVESPEGKWIARVQAGVLIVNQIEPTLFQGTAVRFQFSKDERRDRALIIWT